MSLDDMEDNQAFDESILGQRIVRITEEVLYIQRQNEALKTQVRDLSRSVSGLQWAVLLALVIIVIQSCS